jgi:hypothetical protein
MSEQKTATRRRVTISLLDAFGGVRHVTVYRPDAIEYESFRQGAWRLPIDVMHNEAMGWSVKVEVE